MLSATIDVPEVLVRDFVDFFFEFLQLVLENWNMGPHNLVNEEQNALDICYSKGNCIIQSPDSRHDSVSNV